MAKPRIFVSSTYYDLKHVRASLENFIESLGFEPALSEKGDIAYAPDIPLDESCYREVRSADIFVIIVGGRYGSEKSESKDSLPKGFFDRYDSITKEEYKSAISQDIPVYVLIEKPVYAEFETYLRNKNKTDIIYAHVDSVNVFHLIEEILSQPRNNPIQQFDRYKDIEWWLKEQWAGLFSELLNRLSNQKQLNSLSNQVTNLAEINETLKVYLEEVVSKIAPDESTKLIQIQSERLDNAKKLTTIKSHDFVVYLKGNFDLDNNKIIEALEKCKSQDDFFDILLKADGSDKLRRFKQDHYRPAVNGAINELREELNLPKIDEEFEEEGSIRRRSVRQKKPARR